MKIIGVRNAYYGRCFPTHETLAYAYFINRYGEYQEMSEWPKENSKDLVNYIKRIK